MKEHLEDIQGKNIVSHYAGVVPLFFDEGAQTLKIRLVIYKNKYEPSTRGFELRIPGGGSRPGETIHETAVRELRQEVWVTPIGDPSKALIEVYRKLVSDDKQPGFHRKSIFLCVNFEDTGSKIEEPDIEGVVDEKVSSIIYHLFSFGSIKLPSRTPIRSGFHKTGLRIALKAIIPELAKAGNLPPDIQEAVNRYAFFDADDITT